jgi:hypothetical protein
MAIVVEGLVGFRKALNELAPHIAKNMNAQIRAELAPIINDARAKVSNAIFGAPNNWGTYQGVNPAPTTGLYFPQYDAGEIRRGLTYSMGRQKKTKNGYVSMITLLNKSPAGAISETAGRSHPNGRPQREQRMTRGGAIYSVRTSRQSMSDNPRAGQMMIERLDAQMGMMKNFKGKSSTKTTGRLLYAAYADNQGKALDAIMKVIEDAKREFNRQSVIYDVRSAA